MGFKGANSNFTAASAHEEEHVGPLYHARPSEGVLEWHDGGVTFVAVETPAVNRRTEAKRLKIVATLNKRHLDLIVAFWAPRIYQDTQEEGIREDEADAKKSKAEQRQRDKEEGRPTGVLYGMKEALGINNGLKSGPRSAGMFTGRSIMKEDRRINWEGR